MATGLHWLLEVASLQRGDDVRDDLSPQLVDRLPEGQAARLHRETVRDPSEIRTFFKRLASESVDLDNGVDRANALRRARVADTTSGGVTITSTDIKATVGRQLHFNCLLSGTRYFFSLVPISRLEKSGFTAALPAAIYRAERRDRDREAAGRRTRLLRVEIRDHNGRVLRGSLIDWSDQGIGVRVRTSEARGVGAALKVSFLGGDRAGGQAFGVLRNESPQARGWTRLGLEISDVPIAGQIPVEHRPTISQGHGPSMTRQQKRASGTGDQALVRIVRYRNELGHEISALVNSTGATAGAPAVVISPAWGRTKETFVALAQTLIETFEAAGEPLTVLRFDGTERRGESYVSPDCRNPGSEYLKFTFSRAAKDLHATFRFLETAKDFHPNSIVLVTFSAGAIDGRRAVATDPTSLVRGWVSVVGMVDVQSGLRAVSGGVDYALGVAKGVTFGPHELLGVLIDIDRTGSRDLENHLLFLEDARRDMASIRVPVTWIHGKYDGWIDLGRVKSLLSAGDVSKRKLIELPVGHQMRMSSDALAVFQLISREVARMILGHEITPKAPDRSALRVLERAERARRPRVRVNLKDFWRRYLLGRDRRLGIDLLTATSAYRELMRVQIGLLAPQADELILDLGSGTGAFPLELASSSWPSRLRVVEVDWVGEALSRSRKKFAARYGELATSLRFVGADFGRSSAARVPVGDATADAAIASLLVSYLERPDHMLAEIARILKPGGRLVLSSLRQDADLSRIYIEGVTELKPERVREELGEEFVADFEEAHRTFFNDASHILEIEETGDFRFFEGFELTELMHQAGFEKPRVVNAFGIPPQAVVVAARKRD